jgi:SARP family transcriptional regulator, regulator of embCAB operon
VEISVLGQLEVTQNGKSIAPSAPKPRQVLALLALRANRVVPSAVLMEELWGDRHPNSASTTLQTYILQLRNKILDALPVGHGHPKEMLATRFGGYLLETGRSQSDLQQFEGIAADGSNALEAGDCCAASHLLHRALGLWRGPALADIAAGRILLLDLAAMEESWLRVLGQRIEADLRLGRHGRLVAELRVLVAEHPLDEQFCAQFMLALHRSGKTWRALNAFRELRTTLSSELGIEPSRRLQRLHQAILAGDPELDPDESRYDFYSTG